MKTTKEKRIEKYRTVDETIKSLYADDFLSEKIQNIQIQYATQTEYVPLVNTVGDVILGFYKIADLPRLLQQNVGVSADEAQKITSELIEFLEPVVKREEEEYRNKNNEINTLTKKFEAGANKENKISPLPTENLEKVEPIRTMSKDADRIHGYGALNNHKDENIVKAISQEDTFKPTEKILPTQDKTKTNNL